MNIYGGDWEGGPRGRGREAFLLNKGVDGRWATGQEGGGRGGGGKGGKKGGGGPFVNKGDFL